MHCALPAPAGSDFCCFGCKIARELARPAEDGEPSAVSLLLLRLGLGIFLAMNITIFTWFAYAREIFGSPAQADGIYTQLTGLFSYLALFLSTLVLVLLGAPLLDRRSGARSLILLGVVAAWALSAWNTVRGTGSLYYDTAAMVLVFVTLGGFLEARARRQATLSARRTLAELPQHIRVLRDEDILELDLLDLRIGDLVQVAPGEAIAADGRVYGGTSRLDTSSLTGESRPRAAEPGDFVLAGAIALDGSLLVQAERVGFNTVLAQTERALEAARHEQPPIQHLADRVAAAFVPGVFVLAVGVFSWRFFLGDLEGAVLRTLSILLISCPCALGLAAPLASWQALRRAAEHGILIDSSAVLERAARIEHVVFDKTGTLTEPHPELANVTSKVDLDTSRALHLAASLDLLSRHPIARSLVDQAREAGMELQVPTNFRDVPGHGVEGRLDGRLLRLGSPRWASSQGIGESDPNDETTILLFDEGAILARFELAERPRSGVEQTLRALEKIGIPISLASGDRQAAVERFAERFRLAEKVHGDLLPQEKIDYVRALRHQGRGVAMVGDGLNDAPVLAAADVGIALGSASDLARRSGGVRLIDDRLERIPELFRIARDTQRRIRTNLAFSFGFNLIGLALAVNGTLTPVFAAVAMIVSSLVVVRLSAGAGSPAQPTTQPVPRLTQASAHA